MTKEKVIHLFKNHKIGTLATIKDDKPYSRFMLFFAKDLTLYSATNKQTHKVDTIEENPHVHILLGLENGGYTGAYCEVEASVEIDEIVENKEAFWSDQLSNWLTGSDDPNYVLLKFKPHKIRYFANVGAQAEEISL